MLLERGRYINLVRRMHWIIRKEVCNECFYAVWVAVLSGQCMKAYHHFCFTQTRSALSSPSRMSFESCFNTPPAFRQRTLLLRFAVQHNSHSWQHRACS